MLAKHLIYISGMVIPPALNAARTASGDKIGGVPRATRRGRLSGGRGLGRRWTLNGDFVSLGASGVGRYGRETVIAMDALVGERHPLTLDLDLDLVAPADVKLDNIPVRVVREFKSPRLPQVWVQLQLPLKVPGGLVSFCNLAPISIRRHIACIHDLHTFIMPESYPRGFQIAHRLLLPILGRSAARITTVSNLSRGHLATHGVAKLEKITVTYNGSDHATRWDEAKAVILRPTQRPFVLVLGRPQKYKNISLIFQVAKGLDDLGVDIVMAGDIELAAALPAGCAFPANLHFVGRATDADLAFLYRRAAALLFPSRIEGFGIPAVEAMALGCPVIASNAPCLPEICGDAALYADPDDPRAWLDHVRQVVESPTVSRSLSQKGRVQAAKYTWRNIALIYLELMHEVDGAASARRGQRTQIDAVETP